MATYPSGMTLRGEVRESISLDDDDLSDVEDEVFIRDGKNGYKLAEEMTVKRPLMAPRRKSGKPDITTRLKNKPPCKALCKPCCYVFAALSVLIGLIILVVILVSIFPLPLNKLRDWILSRSKTNQVPAAAGSPKLSPCNNLKITDVWTVNLPKLTTESPVRAVDIDEDGVEDILFGFGTGDNYDIFPSDIFCPIFMGVPSPCRGGLIALNGLNGNIIWRHWLNDTIFHLQCTADVNLDGTNDCLAIGVEGTIAVFNSKNGSLVWKLNTGENNVFVGGFIPDQNHDNVSDILTSHSSLSDGKSEGHLILFSGKNGEELKRVPMENSAKTFFMPQLLTWGNQSYILFGTGGPSSPGNLSLLPLQDFLLENSTVFTSLYRDNSSGILIPSVLVDITGDEIPDIITAMYNSTVVAIDGLDYKQIWNFTVVGKAETNIVPTPGYFNYDNVTDFLVVYEKFDEILKSNYTQTFIIDGKTGKSIYEPINAALKTQINALTLSMEGHGHDMFLFWTSECNNVELFKKIDTPKDNLGDECRRQFNTTTTFKLHALNQFHQPPGLLVYNSENRSDNEFTRVKTPMKQVKEYVLDHPKVLEHGQSEVDENLNVDDAPIGIRKYGSSSFRHKDNRHPDFLSATENNPEADANYEWSQPNDLPVEVESEFDYLEEPGSDSIPYNQKQMYLGDVYRKSSNRDPRSKQVTPSRKKNLSEGIYGLKNVQQSKTRLLHDVNNLPTEILRDTFYKNVERRLRKSKLEQRDINEHRDKNKENNDIRKTIEEVQKLAENTSLNLWDLESEKELLDRENGYWRGKRSVVNYTEKAIRKISSVGVVLDPWSNTTNSIDVVFITYWVPFGSSDEIELCVQEKQEKSSSAQDSSEDQLATFRRDCLSEQSSLKRDFPYFNQINKLRLGQMTVYRVRVECQCVNVNKNERCAKFLRGSDKGWSGYLGGNGDGYFRIRV